MYRINHNRHEILSLEEIVDVYVQKARAKTRLTQYERRVSDRYTLHHITENDQFRVLDHLIAIQAKRVAWVWRNQDFWPTDVLTDVTVTDPHLYNFGVIHGGEHISGVKFTLGPRVGVGSDPDNCLPFVNDFIHLEAHYRTENGAMKLNRARIGVDFLNKNGRTLLARAVYAQNADYAARGFRYRASLGNRLLLQVDGRETLKIDVPTKLSRKEIETIAATVKKFETHPSHVDLKTIFIVKRDD